MLYRGSWYWEHREFYIYEHGWIVLCYWLGTADRLHLASFPAFLARAYIKYVAWLRG